MIDFIITNRRWKNCVLNSRSFPSADIGSDHQLVICTLHLKLKCTKKSNTKLISKHDISKLKDKVILAEYQQQLTDKLPTCTDTDLTLDQAAESYYKIIKITANNILGFTRSCKKPWISNTTLELTDQRRNFKVELATEPGLKPAYNQLTCKICTGINSDNENWRNNNCDELEQLQDASSTWSPQKDQRINSRNQSCRQIHLHKEQEWKAA